MRTTIALDKVKVIFNSNGPLKLNFKNTINLGY